MLILTIQNKGGDESTDLREYEAIVRVNNEPPLAVCHVAHHRDEGWLKLLNIVVDKLNEEEGR